MYENITSELIAFLAGAPTAFHAVAEEREILAAAGYTELSEGRPWKLEEGGNYFVCRNESSLIAFRVPSFGFGSLMMAAAHSDSPTFRIKGEHPEMEACGAYTKLNVEKYGGAIMAPWLDRPLSVAGRLILKKEGRFTTKLVKVDRDLVLIPNLAIHMNHDINDAKKFNAQVDMLPLFGDEEAKEGFLKTIAAEAGVEASEIAAADLYLYSRVPGTVWGAKGEYFSSGRLDDLQCGYALLRGFLDAAENKASLPVYCLFDNEEVGSGTKQGADSTFLTDVLTRIAAAAGRTPEELKAAIAAGFMISADNAHAIHPNQPEKADPLNQPKMNKGIVIKYHAGQKYTTDSVSAALFKEVCARADVPVQEFFNRSDMSGGTTLGNIANSHVSLNTVDIGLPQLAMHSPYETAGTADTAYLARALKEFYSLALTDEGQGCYTLK